MTITSAPRTEKPPEASGLTPRLVKRQTTQHLMPARVRPTAPGLYDIYPAFPLGPGRIQSGFGALGAALGEARTATLDGYVGVDWPALRQGLDAALRGRRIRWTCIDEALRPEAEVERLVAPFLGGDDPLFGRRFTGELAAFFDPEALRALDPDAEADLSIIYGPGAALAGWAGPLAYADAPKNEIQFRARAGGVNNLGMRAPQESRGAYKRFYFVDWPLLNAHKGALLPRIDWMIDGQRPEEPTFCSGEALREGLGRMSRNYFRARPWFEPGPWGGQWIKGRIPQLAQDVPNYAWSFELISPENGIVFESDGLALEASFDLLMHHDAEAVLGASGAARFGLEFPIRFDFLDTVDGGNLSLQCHPRLGYIREHFGERITQDETYYILDCEPEADVYLGFQDDIDPAAFREALERSEAEGAPVDVERFVQRLPARRHDLFLIPSGTVHCSGEGSLVLEISATPYIFTFKMYDWLRLDLNGRPRPLNIARAFENLNFERRGKRVAQELVARSVEIGSGPGWSLVHLPTHPEHFYDVHRYDFTGAVEVGTDGGPHVLSLVEGRSVRLETAGGMRQRFNYAETFVVPAAAGAYRLVNEGTQPAKVVKAFLKPERSA